MEGLSLGEVVLAVIAGFGVAGLNVAGVGFSAEALIAGLGVAGLRVASLGLSVEAADAAGREFGPRARANAAIASFSL